MTAKDGTELRPASESAEEALARGGIPRIGTLPPPTWVVPEGPMSAATLALEQHEWEAPVARRLGPRAELQYLERAVARAVAAKDTLAERTAATELGRALVARGVEFARAIELAFRALEIREDLKLRAELAQWCAGLGQPARAALVLSPATEHEVGVRAARTRTRIALLQARAGDAPRMAETLHAALSLEPLDPAPAELLGALAAWAPGVVPPSEAAEFYLEGNRRRQARGDRLGAIEDLVRAFEAAPESRIVTDCLAETLRARGRGGAADEVLREHAQVLGEAGGPVHQQRLRDAVRDEDAIGALGAVFDAGFDQLPRDAKTLLASLDPAGGPASAHAIFEAAGLRELNLARLELALPRVAGPERAKLGVLYGNLCFEGLEQVDRAVEAWVDAVVSDPSNLSARAQLRMGVERTGDPRPLIDALSSVVHAADTDRAIALGCLEELAGIGRSNNHPSLRVWALEHRAALLGHEGALDIPADMKEQERQHAADLARALTLLDHPPDGAGSDRERGHLLAFMERALWVHPPDDEHTLRVLGELVARDPKEVVFRAALERRLRLLGRVRDLEAHYFGSMASEAAVGGKALPGRARARLALCRLWARSGELRRALDELREMLAEPTAPSQTAYFMASLAAELDEPLDRARAIAAFARFAKPEARAVLFSIAAEFFERFGEFAAARLMCARARMADPSITRASVLEAKLALNDSENAEPRDLERAMGVAVPRSTLCGALARAYQRHGEPELGLAWAQRQLVLKPGDLAVAGRLLESVLFSKDGGRVAGTLTWLLSQPQPLEALTSPLVHALGHLSTLDTTGAAKVARRALDVLGPHSAEFRDVVLSIADRAGERGLGLTLLERWLATNPDKTAQGKELLELADRRRETGDADGAARTLLRAARAGADPREVLAGCDTALPPRGSDGEIALLEARAHALSLIDEPSVEEKVEAWRSVGAARWDLALDPAWALEAWGVALALEPERGTRRLARDLVSFGGHADAIRYLEERAALEEDPSAGARYLASAASVALHANLPREAQALAVRSLRLDPGRADALTLAERTATPGDASSFEEIYSLLASSACGCYGERAAHYRAARHFEKHGQLGRALRHAVAAFEAVPSEGVAFVAMVRIGEILGDTDACAAAISRVAELSRKGDASAVWLRHVAALTGAAERPSYLRTDLLLRTLAVSPSVEALTRVGAAMRELAKTEPDERESLLLRFERAVKALVPRLEGPQGAGLLLKAAEVALGDLGAAGLALRAIQAALRCAGDSEEYSAIVPFVMERLNPMECQADAESTINLLGELDSERALGRPALELGAWLAERLGQKDNARRLFGRAAQAMQPPERFRYLMGVADEAEASGRLEEAIDSLVAACSIESQDAEAEQKVRERLAVLYRRTERLVELRNWLERELDRPLLAEAHVRWVKSVLSELACERRDFPTALTLLRSELERHPNDLEQLKRFERVARQAGDSQAVRHALELSLPVTHGAGERVRLSLELGQLCLELEDFAAASKWWHEALEQDPQNLSALAALERDAERRGEYDVLADVLERRAHLARNPGERRGLRLRRARVLEERLGNTDGAKEALELLIEEGDLDVGVVVALAELYQRMGSLARAAPLFAEALGMAAREERLPLVWSAAQAYLQTGDVDRARQILEVVPPRERDLATLELAVLVERRGRDRAALSRALGDLAQAEVRSSRRVELLVEAVHAALGAGDQALARTHAQNAARAQPVHADARLLAYWLGYLERGTSSEPDLTQVAETLEALLPEFDDESLGLAIFLLAEFLDASSSGAGLSRLRAITPAGQEHPLVALALAERLARTGDAERALDLFDAALAGDLRQLRTKGDVAVAAARAAVSLDQHERALRILEAYPEGRTREIQDLRETILAARATRPAVPREPTSQPRVPEPLAAAPVQRVVRIGSSPPPALSATLPLPEPARVGHAVSATLPLPEPARVGHALSARRPTQLGLAAPATADRRVSAPRRTQLGLGAPAPPVAEKEKSEPQPHRVASRPSVAVFAPVQESPMERAIVDHGQDEPRTDGEGSRASEESTPAPTPPPAPPPETPVAASPSLEDLDRDFEAGSLSAGRALILELEKEPEKSRELLLACQRVVVRAPGNVWALGRLAQAALANGLKAHARALEHVVGAFGPDGVPVEPPALDEIVARPELVEAALLSDVSTAAVEALALLWETAGDVLRRELKPADEADAAPVSLAAADGLSWRYAAAARLLGQTHAPLFVRGGTEAPSLRVILRSPPALLLSGLVLPMSTEFAFHLGAMLAATRPQFAILFGANEPQVRTILGALSLAFGPAVRGNTNMASSARLAEALWQTVPPRVQRQLKELCHNPSDLEYPATLALARRAVRRAGLFVAGDLRVALQEVCAEDGLATAPLSRPGGLMQLCESSPVVLDLVRFATSEAYAALRWQVRGKDQAAPPETSS